MEANRTHRALRRRIGRGASEGELRSGDSVSVRDLAGPHQIPQRTKNPARTHPSAPSKSRRRGRLSRARPGSFTELAVHRAQQQQQPQSIRQVQRDSPVVRAEQLHAGPHNTAGCTQHVEVAGPVFLDARGQHLRLPTPTPRTSLELLDGREGAHRDAGSRTAHALPLQQKTTQRRLLDRLNLAPQLQQQSAV